MRKDWPVNEHKWVISRERRGLNSIHGISKASCSALIGINAASCLDDGTFGSWDHRSGRPDPKPGRGNMTVLVPKNAQGSANSLVRVVAMA